MKTSVDLSLHVQNYRFKIPIAKLEQISHTDRLLYVLTNHSNLMHLFHNFNLIITNFILFIYIHTNHIKCS